MARIGAGKEKKVAEPIAMDISDNENTTTMASGGSGDQGSVPPEGDDAQTPKATNGAGVRSSSSSTAREESTPVVDNNRRRSGRVVRPPKKLADEVPPQSAPAKRKRAVVESVSEDEEMQDASEADNESNGEEEDDEEEEEEDEDDSDDNSSDEEEAAEEELRDKKKAAKKKTAEKKTAAPPAAKSKAPPVKKARTASGAVPVPVKKAKRPAGTNGTGPKPTASRKGKGRQRPRERPATSGGDNVLFDAVLDADNLSLVASDWTIKYQEDGPEAMKQLVNFFLRCCGCEQSVTIYDIEDQDTAAATLSQIQEVFQKQHSPDYPLISKRPEFRGFRKTLSDFLHSLLEHITAKELLYTDPALIENIQVWIIAMSSSTLRPFRHTSTIISFSILTTLCDTASELRKSIVTATRQLEAENKKSKVNQGRVKALEEKITEGEERRDSVEVVIKDIFDAVFVHRYRDIDPKIRTDCVHELATWILKLPDMFFDGQYLRYLGWVLSDTSSLTRAEVIKSLSRIFKNKDNISGMRNFTERFRPRLVEMATRDADSNVRAMTVELLDVVREVGFLEASDVDTIGRLLFDSDARVRKAVVGFFVKNIEDMYEEKIEELGGKEAVDAGMAGIDELDDEYSGPRILWVKLKCLVEALSAYDEGNEDDGESGAESQAATGAAEKLGPIVREGAVESRFSLAGAALWESFPEAQDWEGIARYLLYDHSAAQVEEEDDESGTVEEKIRRSCALDAKEEVILLQVLNASVAATIIAGENNTAVQTKKTRGKRKPEGSSKEDVSRSLTQLIPPLLRKFGPVPDAASTVLRLEQLMKLDVYSELRQSTAYASLLDDINRQFLTHADESVLKEASAALLHAKSFEELDEVTVEKIGQLQEETLAVLMACVRDRDIATQKLGDGVVTELINTVRRLEYLASITDVREMLETVPTAKIASNSKRKGKQANNESTNSKLPVKVLLALLNRGTSLDELEEELIVRVLKVLLFYFMWKVKALSEVDPKDITELDIDDLQERRKEMIMAVARIITSRSTDDSKIDGMDAVRIAAAGTLLDVYTLFATLQHRIDIPQYSEEAANGEDLIAVREALARLVSFSREMPEDLQAAVLNVFSKAEKKFAKAAGKPLESPAEGESFESDSESENQNENNDEDEDIEEDECTLLTYEQRLCEFTGKIVLAVLGEVVNKDKFLKRVSRNEKRLGKNFAEVVGHLLSTGSDDEDAPKKGGKQGKSATGQKKGKEISEDEEEMEDRIVVGSGKTGGVPSGRDEEREEEDHGEEEEHEEEEDNEEEEEHEEEVDEEAGAGEESEKGKSLSPSPVIEDEDEEMVDA